MMKGREVIEGLRRKLGNHQILTDGALAAKLGISAVGLRAWKSQSKKLSARQVVGLVDKAVEAAEIRAHRNSIRPIIEFFDLEAQETISGKRVEIFSSETAEEHPYLKGLKEELKHSHGVYIF